MSYVVMSCAKRCVSTSHAWRWPRRLFFGLVMVLFLPVLQSVAATPFCDVELNLTSVDFSGRGAQGGSVDALNDTAQLKTHGSTFSAEYRSSAELGYRFTPQSSGHANLIFFGGRAVGRLRGSGEVNEGQVNDYHEEPVFLTMTVSKVGAAKDNRCMHKHETMCA